jgi:hypothetical protein
MWGFRCVSENRATSICKSYKRSLCLLMLFALNAMIFRGLWTAIFTIFQQSKYSFSYESNLFLFCHRTDCESSHNLLHHSEGKKPVRCITICIFSLHWLTWNLIGVLMCILYWRLLLFFFWWLLPILLFGSAKSGIELSVGCCVFEDFFPCWLRDCRQQVPSAL